MNNMELETDIEALDMEMGEITIHYCPVIPNPAGEPTAELKTADIEGTIYEIVDEEARTELENKVDKVEGKDLSTNDYTDEDKAIVDGVTTALDGKVDKDGDKVLSDNNYSDTDKAIVDGVTSALNDKADKSDTYTKLEVNSALDDKADKSDTYTKTEVNSALNGKVDKDGDKVLSDNNYSDTDKSIVDGVTTALSDKVDKEEGKGLSSNDYTDTEKALVGTIEDKLDKTETAVNSNGLVIATPVTDTAPYIYRQTPVKESFKALMKKIVGASVVWNEVFDYNKTNSTSILRSTISQNGKVYTVTENRESANTSFGVIFNNKDNIQGNHKVLVRFRFANFNVSDFTSFDYYLVKINGEASSSYIESRIMPTSNTVISNVLSVSDETNRLIIRAYTASRTGNESSFTVDNVNIIDLTTMFGTTIADYVYTLETSQSGSGIAWLQSYGFFTEDYYTYKQNKLESGCVSAKKIVGKNLCPLSRYWEDGTIDTSGQDTTGAYFRTVGYWDILPNKALVISGVTMETKNRIFFYDVSKNFINYKQVNSFTVPENARYFRMKVSNTLNPNNVQIEYGSTATPYEPRIETTYPIEPVTLRGILGLSTDKLTVDGDEYNADGTVTRKYGIVVYDGSNDENWTLNANSAFIIAKPSDIVSTSFPNALSDKFEEVFSSSSQPDKTFYIGGSNIGIKNSDTADVTAWRNYLSNNPLTIIYPLATFTTEQTTPFTETEIVGSTEEFIDYEVTQSNRDVAIPVGTDTDYYQEMKLPSLPTTSGNHNLQYNPASGFRWS